MAKIGESGFAAIMLKVSVCCERDCLHEGKVWVYVGEMHGVKGQAALEDHDKKGDNNHDDVYQQGCDEVLLPAHCLLCIYANDFVNEVFNWVEYFI